MSHLNISVSLNFNKGGAILNRSLHAGITITGNVPHSSVQVIGTDEEAVTFPSDMGSVGYVILHNLDATNFISVGRTTGVYTIKVPPGEFCLFRLLSGTEFFAKADTGACDMEKILIEV